MIHPEIPYEMISEAINFYRLRGFSYIEVPWVVTKEAMNITALKSSNQSEGDMFVASGEQSFMQLRLDNALENGYYVCATPCYRPWDKGRDYLHYSQFFKVELILLDNEKPLDEDYLHITHTAFSFMTRYRSDLNIIEITDEPRLECKTLISHDIVTESGIEFGSYGVRYHDKIGYWVYGTGIALPRFQQQEMVI